MSKSKEQAKRFVLACQAAGFSWETKGTIVRVKKKIAIGDREAFISCDMDAPGLLSLVPGKGGSVWGTDGGSIGGMVALKTGDFVLNKSGVGSRFVAALSNYQAGDKQ